MLRPLLLVLLYCAAVSSINCDFGYEDIGDGFCYKTYPFAATNIKSEIECERDGAHLVVPRNSFLNNLILNEATSEQVDVWLGIICTSSSASECNLFNGNNLTSVTYTNFMSGHPNPSLGKCVYLASTGSYRGRWYSAPCDNLKGFGCLSRNYTNGVDKCGSSYTEFNENCYKILPYQEGSTADELCSLDCGQTTSITSYAENEFIRGLGQQSLGNGYVLIGLHLNQTTDYTWSDGSILAQGNYSNFGLVEPDIGSCMSMALENDIVQQGQWVTSSCGNKLPAVCKRALHLPCVPKTVPQTNAIPQCPYITFLEQNRTIYSPGYPAAVASASCEYVLQGPSDHIVKFEVESYSGSTALYFYEEVTDTQPFLAPNGFRVQPEWYGTTGPSMKLKYSGVGESHLKASFSYIDMRTSGCNRGVLNTPGTITSPAFPDRYPNYYKCNYRLQAPIGMRVTLRFGYFLTEAVDPVIIYDGPDSSFSQLVSLSGGNTDKSFTSTSNNMFVTFTTDFMLSYPGFNATFNAIN